MLQFGGVMCNAVARFAPRTIWRINQQQLLSLSSSAAPNPNVISAASKNEDAPVKEKRTETTKSKGHRQSALVEAVFASLMDPSNTPATNEKDSVATAPVTITKSVDKLLSVTANRDISHRHALNIVSILADWTNQKKISLKDFEKDPRFQKLCQQLAGMPDVVYKYQNHTHGELSTILGLTGDDDAAKLISTFSLEQMITVIVNLARKQRRSPVILRSLSYNLARCSQKLNVKQAADLLHAMAKLHFPDEVLLEKTSTDLLEVIPNTSGNAVIGSIVTSLGFLRYKNVALLDSLCEWVLAGKRSLKSQFLSSLLLTLATVSHVPANADEMRKVLLDPLTEADVSTSDVWLDIVWASLVLGIATPANLSTVLDSTFIRKLSDSNALTLPRRVKLLNINAAAKYITPDYEGGFLDTNFEKSSPEISKSKQLFINSVIDALANISLTTQCLHRNVNTGMGFSLAGECYVDESHNILPVDRNPEKLQSATRVAIIPLQYNDFCRGVTDPIGIYSLMHKLLEARGYAIAYLPYTEYDADDTLAERSRYIESKIKSTISTRRT